MPISEKSLQRGGTPRRSATPTPRPDASRLFYDEDATRVLRSRFGSDRSASSDSDRRARAPFTPRINSTGTRNTRPGDVFEALYDTGMEKKKHDLDVANANAFVEVDKLWSSYRVAHVSKTNRPPWDGAAVKATPHAPRSTTPTRCPWANKAAMLSIEEEKRRREALRRNRAPSPSIVRQTQSSMNKDKHEWISNTTSREATPTRQRPLSKQASARLEQLSRPKTVTTRPVLDVKLAKKLSAPALQKKDVVSDVGPHDITRPIADATKQQAVAQLQPNLEVKPNVEHVPATAASHGSTERPTRVALREQPTSVTAHHSQDDHHHKTKRRLIIESMKIDSDEETEHVMQKSPCTDEDEEEIAVTPSTPIPQHATANIAPSEGSKSERGLSAIMKQLDAV